MPRYDLPWDDQIRLAGIRGCLESASPEKLREIAAGLPLGRLRAGDPAIEVYRAATALDGIRRWLDEIEADSPGRGGILAALSGGKFPPPPRDGKGDPSR